MGIFPSDQTSFTPEHPGDLVVRDSRPYRTLETTEIPDEPVSVLYEPHGDPVPVVLGEWAEYDESGQLTKLLGKPVIWPDPVPESPPARPKQRPYVHRAPFVGRNDRCPCGSGLKWKKCHREQSYV